MDKEDKVVSSFEEGVVKVGDVANVATGMEGFTTKPQTDTGIE